MTPDKNDPDPAPWARLSQAAARAAGRVQRQDRLEELPSAASLRALVERRLKGRELVLASNREPYVHVHRDGAVAWYRAAGGLTIALDSMAAACGASWVCQGSGDADFEVADA